MNEDEVKELIENAIYLNFQFEIKYTNSRGETSEYDILKITSTSEKNFTCIADPKGGKEKRPFYKFRCDRISSLELTNEGLHTHDFLIDKIRNNELFTSDDFVNILGGTKTSGYVSSVNPISKLPPKITKKEAEDLLNKINLPIISGWSRGVIFFIKYADTYGIL